MRLQGITWDHRRAAGPLLRSSADYECVQVTWGARSLQEFAEVPVRDLAREYDLVVLDHPHIGALARSGAVVALDDWVDADILAALDRRSVGGSHASYRFADRQWAFALDAAAQVSALRPDLLAEAPRDWDGVDELAASGRVLWPLKPADAVCSFMTFMANRGVPWPAPPLPAPDHDEIEAALAAMRVTAANVPRECLELNPIDVLEQLAASDSFAYSPLLFGYLNYSTPGFRPHALAFGDLPGAPGRGPVGSILGGAGLAVSARCEEPEAAVAYALWVASGPFQASGYVESGGQPAHLDAWEDAELDAIVGGFFATTRATMDGAWMRPRSDGFVDFQNRAGVALTACLGGGTGIAETARLLRRAHGASHG